jgi:superfamily I DNA/RNA helicase
MAAADRIATADSFLLERLKTLDHNASIDWNGKTLLELAARYPVAGLEPRELAAEVENFIWANDVSMEEYVSHLMDRKGMRKALPKAARYSAWVAAESIALEMEATGSYTRNYAALKLVHARQSAGGDAGNTGCGLKPSVDYVFIDEAQDLPAVVLKALKQAARRCVLLAGDADQSIYQPGFSFKRTGIDTGGRTRILRSNFRNTVQIHELAERYRSIDSCHDHENSPEAFRDGPVPELFRGTDRKALLELLVQRLKLFIDTLGYEAQNIGILVPSNDDIAFIRGRLAPLDLALANIREPDFSFDSTGQVRICTLHSAKGLDFPVVLLFMDRPPFFGSGYDEESVDRMSANLVYVALTRAMDHLNVFTLEKPGCHALESLVRAFEA